MLNTLHDQLFASSILGLHTLATELWTIELHLPEKEGTAVSRLLAQGGRLLYQA